MLIAITRYTKSLAEVELHRENHINYLKTNLLDTGKLVLAGRQKPVTGAVIIVKDMSSEEFERLLKDDPYTVAGVADYQIVEVTPGLMDVALQEFLTTSS